MTTTDGKTDRLERTAAVIKHNYTNTMLMLILYVKYSDQPSWVGN